MVLLILHIPLIIQYNNINHIYLMLQFVRDDAQMAIIAIYTSRCTLGTCRSSRRDRTEFGC